MEKEKKSQFFADRHFAVAPMMGWTDRHCRFFHRQLSRRARLYTEMVTTGAVLHGDRQRLLAFHPDEQPVALQLGGADPDDLARSVEIAEAFGYSEINLNVGCPSDRVQSGRFGACLMAVPKLVADCVSAMGRSTALPVTVKCRIGIDDQDSYGFLKAFVETVAAGGCHHFILHARKAWLTGLSPKENREIPPLHHDRVYRLKQELPELRIVINGGIETVEEALRHLSEVDGVMVGRAAYQNPYLLAAVDRVIFGDSGLDIRREAVVDAMMSYSAQCRVDGVPIKAITRHILGLFNGLPGARAWRRELSESAHHVDAGAEVIAEALVQLQARQPRRAA